MSWHLALSLPLEVSLADFSRKLHATGIPHRISEARGEQQLWVADVHAGEQVRDLYRQYQANPDSGPLVLEVKVPPAVREQQRRDWLQQARRLPVVALIILATLGVALWTQLGNSLPALAGLTFNRFVVEGEYAYFYSLQATLAAGEWWRLLTPMLIHFGWLHLAMNLLWFWELGRRIELQQGSLFLLLLCLLSALISNFSQYLFSGANLFGGLSGVLYALLGYCWIHQRLFALPAYRLPNGVVGMMLVWLALCMSGLVTAMGFGQIANAAHLGGLITGCVAGAGMGLLARARNKRREP